MWDVGESALRDISVNEIRDKGGHHTLREATDVLLGWNLVWGKRES